MNKIDAAILSIGNVWAIDPQMLLTSAYAGEWCETEEPQAATPRIPKTKGPIAILPLTGLITQRGGGFLSFLMGGTTTREFGEVFDEMVANPNVGGIVLDVHSPGGSVFGVGELAAKIYAARGTKPILSVVNSMAASAAYYIASAADQVVMTPSGMAGSIGVVMTHVDESEANEAEGIKVTKVFAGARKLDTDSSSPITDEARAEMQSDVDFYYGQFVGAVAKFRGMSKSDVRGTEAAVYTADNAKEIGLVDRIATLDDVIATMQSTLPKGTPKRNRATAAIALSGADIQKPGLTPSDN